jgi:hypothetical protein
MTTDPYAQQPTQPATPAYTYQAPQPAQPPQPTVNLTAYLGATLGTLGALLIIVGSFMPWATVQTVFGTLSLAGTDGDADGKLFLVGGVVLAVGAVATGVTRHFWLGVLQLFATVIAAGAAAWELLYISTRLEQESSEYAVASAGSGLYVLLLGGLLAAVGAVVHLFQHR